MMKKRRSFIGCLAVMFGFSALSLAGDINPPPGPVGPTMKTLVEIEPRVAVQSLPSSEIALHVISEPGSYYLTGNIIGVSGKHGIEVASDSISIDLNGFSLIGSADALSAVAVLELHHSLTVNNGSIIDWPVWAIGGIGTADASLMSNLIVKSLSGGITVGTKSLITKCSIDTIGGGLVVGDGSIVEHCTIASEGSVGINAGQNVRILNCLINACGNDGIRAGSKCVIRDCSLSNNRRDGIRVSGDNVVIIGNSCIDNGQGLVGHGIFADGSGSRIDDNYCAGNDIGIKATGSSSGVLRNMAYSNGTNYIIVGGVISNNPATAGPWANLEN